MSRRGSDVGKGWDSNVKLPVGPPAISTIRNNRSPQRGGGSAATLSSLAYGSSRAASGALGDARLARMMTALDEHERRDPRSRQSRMEATFYASLRLMLREALEADGPLRGEQVAQLESWFDASKPRERAYDEGDELEPHRPLTGGASGTVSPRAAGAFGGGVRARAGGFNAARTLADASTYTPNDVGEALSAYRRRDLYASFAQREGLGAHDALAPAARVVPGAARAPEPPPKSFGAYQLSADPFEAQQEARMDESWAARRRAEAADAADEEQMGVVVERWAVSRARVDEDIARRREGSLYAAEGVHATRAQPAREALGMLALDDETDDDSADDEPGGSASRAGASSRARSLRSAGSRGGAATARARVSAHPRVIVASLPAGHARFGASSFAAGGDAAGDGAADARAERPTTAQALFRAGAAARTAFPLAPPPPPPRPPPKVDSSKAATARGAAKGAAAAAPAGGAIAASGRTYRPLSAPSAQRIMQLQECQRIKSAFDQLNLRLDTATLERALLTPEDMPADYCLSALTTFRSREVDPNPSAKAKGKKGTKKKKAKGGKKAKKK